MANPNDHFPDPNIGEKLRAAAELRDARAAYVAAEKALRVAWGRLSTARSAAKRAGVDLNQAWGAEPVKEAP